jgi:integrase
MRRGRRDDPAGPFAFPGSAMPPPKGHLPKLCVRQDGRAYATDPATRKPVYFGRAGPAAQRKYAEWVARLADRREQVASGQPAGVVPTVSRLVLDYLSHADRYYRKRGKPTTEPGTIRQALRPLVELYGTEPADRVGPSQLKAVRSAMERAELARGHVNDQVGRIKRVFKWAVEHELVPPAVLLGLQAVAPLKRGRTEAPEEESVEPVELAMVLATLPLLAPPWRALCECHLAIGCRADEVRQLRGADIDRSAVPWVFTPDSHKTEHLKGRKEILLGAAARQVLTPLLAAKPPGDWLFPGRGRGRHAGRYAGPATVSGYRQAVEAACLRAGQPHWTPLQIRHSVATWVRAKFGLEAAQHVLGHSRADVTQLYAERNKALAIRVVEEGWLEVTKTTD